MLANHHSIEWWNTPRFNKMIYVADTHALVWFLTNSNELSSKAKELFEKADRGEIIVIIPSISLMELAYVCRKKNIIPRLKEILKKMKHSLNYIVWDLNLEVIVHCLELKKITEMHDRIIVATAMITKATVITKDSNICESEYIKIIW